MRSPTLPGSNKRERELARAKYERQQAKRNAMAARRRQRYQVVTAVVVAVVVVVGLVGLAKVFHHSGTSVNAGASKSPVSTLGATSTPTPSPSISTSPVPTDGSPALCTYAPAGTASKPTTLPAKSAPTRPATRTAKLSLNGQVVTIQLLASKAPCTVNSFVHLATTKWFDGVPCHRLTSGGLSVLQCGDPTGTGSGGPGYSFGDENLTGATYLAGTVAMANAGPGTNGSQFFLVYADSQLPPSYTPFGKIVGGMPALDAIAAAGIKGGGSDGAPAKPVTITSVVVGN
jgi:peptidyl-prolyl cis-trans isomerase B (cyclophilin B)